MKSFNEFLADVLDEAVVSDDGIDASDTAADTKKNVLAFLTSNLYRFINEPDERDNKGLLMIIAALTVLNTSDNLVAIQTARRLGQMALVRTGKKRAKAK